LLRLATAMFEFWWFRGAVSEERQWLEAALAASETRESTARAKALLYAGLVAGLEGDFTRGVEALESSAALCRALGDVWNSTMATHFAALTLGWKGEYVAARRAFAE